MHPRFDYWYKFIYSEKKTLDKMTIYLQSALTAYMLTKTDQNLTLNIKNKIIQAYLIIIYVPYSLNRLKAI